MDLPSAVADPEHAADQDGGQWEGEEKGARQESDDGPDPGTQGGHDAEGPQVTPAGMRVGLDFPGEKQPRAHDGAKEQDGRRPQALQSEEEADDAKNRQHDIADYLHFSPV